MPRFSKLFNESSTIETVFHHISDTEKRVEDTMYSGVLLAKFDSFDIQYKLSIKTKTKEKTEKYKKIYIYQR